jgi:hypothetical protein
MAEWGAVGDSGWWQVGTMWLGGVVAALFAWGFWTLRHSFVLREEFSASEQRNEERDVKIESRITKLETRVDNLPTAESLHKVLIQLTQVCAKMEGLEERMSSIDQRLGLVYEILLNREAS